MSHKKIRCLLISEMLQPYRIPVFDYLAKSESIEFKVLCLSIKEGNREWDLDLSNVAFEYEILPSFDYYIHCLDWGFHFSLGVRKKIDEWRPDVIVGTGYASPAFLIAQAYARKHGIGYVMWSGTTESSSRIKNAFIQKVKSLFIRRCDAFLAYGTAAARFLVKMGANQEQIFVGINTVDVEFYRTSSEIIRQTSAVKELRRNYPPFLILYVGQIIERKGIDTLIEAFSKMESKMECGLVLVGSGLKLNEYKQRYRGVKNVYWIGYCQIQDLLPYYAAADLLVIPSQIEVWGLVVNEAMACGVPVLAADTVGAVEDLVTENQTGFIFPAGDVETLRNKLDWLVANEQIRTAVGIRGQEYISKFTPDHYAERLVEAVEYSFLKKKK